MLEKTLESPLDCKKILPGHPNGDKSWVFIRRTDDEAETPVLLPPIRELTHWKRPWCWEGSGAGREGDDRGWEGWMASPTRWIWVWVGSRYWWWTGRPGVLSFMGRRVGHDWSDLAAAAAMPPKAPRQLSEESLPRTEKEWQRGADDSRPSPGPSGRRGCMSPPTSPGVGRWSLSLVEVEQNDAVSLPSWGREEARSTPSLPF